MGMVARADQLPERDVACEWLRDNTDIWSEWLPDSTRCLAKQGLVNAAGFFVDELGSAEDCGFCEIGRYSEKFESNVTKTTNYRCTMCSSGRYQSQPGMTACQLCDKGFYQAEKKLARNCEACPAGTFSNIEGATGCGKCEDVKIGSISLPGSTTAEACVCPDDHFEERDGCHPYMKLG